MTNWGNTNLVRGKTPDRSDRSQQRPAQVRPMHQEYRIKEKKDESVPMQVDSEKFPTTKVVQVEDGKGKAQDAQGGPVVVEKPVNVSQKLVLANDHEASSSNLKDQDKEKYFQPRWCPPGLTHTQKRRLQRLRRPKNRRKKRWRSSGMNSLTSTD